MAERPILFSGAMVCAILAGTKTQTRRICKPAEEKGLSGVVNCGNGTWGDEEGLFGNFRCPHGSVGDRLWVRESHWWFKDEPDHSCGYYPPKLTQEDVMYRADGDDGRRTWRPSIHMPRWASRITLEITDVRVERLNSISEEDARAEGIVSHRIGTGDARTGMRTAWGLADEQAWAFTPEQAYQDLWERINGPGSWDDRWVWALTFRRITTSTPEAA